MALPDKRLVGIVSIVLALGVAAVGQLSWIRSGSARRNSYEMLRSAQRLGLDELTPLRVLWYLIPVVSLSVVLLVLAGRSRSSAVLLGLESTVVGVAGVVTLSSGLAVGLGAPLATAHGAAGLLVAGFQLAPDRCSSRVRIRSIQPLSPTKDDRSGHRATPAPSATDKTGCPVRRTAFWSSTGRRRALH